MIKAVIFDFNGTMVFDSKYHDKAWKVFSKKIRGSEVSDEEIYTHFHGAVNEKIIEYLKPEIDVEENKKLSLEKEAIYRELCSADKENYTLVYGLEDYMLYLKDKKIAMNIASASIKENIDFFISTFALDRFMDSTKIKYDDGSYENKIDMFKDAAKDIGYSINECLVFEDSMTGIKCARKAGAGMVIGIGDVSKFALDKTSGVDDVIQDFSENKIRTLFKGDK